MSMFKPTTKPSLEDVKPYVKGEKGAAPARYPYRLNFYTTPPSLDITLEEFETCALERLRVLTYIESLEHRNLPAAQKTSALTTYLKSHCPLSSNTARTADLARERRHDEIGHWVLRLAFSRSPELRARFLNAEEKLFRHRYETDDGAERAEFLKNQKLDWQEVTGDEKRVTIKWKKAENSKDGSDKDGKLTPVTLEDRLRVLVPRMRDGATSEKWYKVPWMTVPDLVQSRRVYIQNGNAYVPQSMQLNLVQQAFCERLEKALEITAKNLPRLDEDERLGPVIDHLAASFLAGVGGDEYTSTGSGEGVTAAMIDDVARKHFSPCMLSLYIRLKETHHLKHFGRRQLTLFLKGIGLPLDEALIFWRRAYGPSMTDDKFAKEYKYNIRHSYGQEGGRKNYTPLSCQQILTQNQPGPQDTHGCPFRHFSADTLGTFLVSNYELERGGGAYLEIMDNVKNNHYHLACTRLFEATHGEKKGEGLGGGVSVNHPNQWFDRSRELEGGTTAKMEE